MKYIAKYDGHGLPIPSKGYILAQIEEFLGLEHEPADWEAKIGGHPSAARRVILYALRIARRDLTIPPNKREDRLIQLCRKFSANQPPYWARFLRERYQYARTKDFFAVDYNDIVWEYYAYDDECDALGADPDATGRVFDAAPKWRALMADMNKIAKRMPAVASPAEADEAPSPS